MPAWVLEMWRFSRASASGSEQACLPPRGRLLLPVECMALQGFTIPYQNHEHTRTASSQEIMEMAGNAFNAGPLCASLLSLVLAMDWDSAARIKGAASSSEAESVDDSEPDFIPSPVIDGDVW